MCTPFYINCYAYSIMELEGQQAYIFLHISLYKLAHELVNNCVKNPIYNLIGNFWFIYIIAGVKTYDCKA